MFESSEKTEQITLCYSATNFTTLVMLYSPEHVLKKMLQPSQKIRFLWVAHNVDQCLEIGIKQLREQTGVILDFFTDMEQVESFLKLKHQNESFIIICQPELTPKANQIKAINKQIKEVIEFSISQKQSRQHQEDFNQSVQSSQNAEEEQKRQLQRERSPIHKYNKILNQIKKKSHIEPEYKKLMNFVPLKDQVWKTNVLMRTMMAMVNQEIDMDTRRGMLGQFKKLIDRVGKNQHLYRLIDELEKGELSLERAIHWYTFSNGIYRILNNLLRSSLHPAQIFYVQPFFKDLFQAIKNLQKQNTKNKYNFICYRGGTIEENELKVLENNVGHIIKNLSFFSTSLRIQTAELFKDNVLFEIHVKHQQSQSTLKDYDYGYANVKDYSFYYSQDEIIFNPLNSFKVLDIKKFQNGKGELLYTLIKLQYGILTQLLNKNKNQLKENQKLLYSLEKQWKYEERRTINQGIIFTSGGQILSDSGYYWENYHRLVKIPYMKAVGLYNWAKCQKNKGNYSQSERLCLKSRQILDYLKEKENGNEFKSIQKASMAIQIEEFQGQILLKMGKHEKALEIQQKCCKKMLALKGVDHPRFLQFQSNLASTLHSIGKFEQALKIQQKCCQALEKTLGECNPSYIGNLYMMTNTLRSIGNYGQTERLQEKCCNLYRHVQGQWHENYLNCLSSLAITFKNQSKYEKALELLEKCCQIAKVSLGERHPNYLGFRSNLATTLCCLGQYEKALKIQTMSLVSNQLRGENNPEYIHSLDNLATIFKLSGKYQQALKLQQKCCKLSLTVFGKRHPHTLAFMNNFAITLYYLGLYARALEMQEYCEKTRRQVLGTRHPEYLNSLNSLSCTLQRMKNYNRALKLQEKCCEIGLIVLGERNHDYIVYLNTLAIIHEKLGNFQKAYELQQKCCSLYLQILGQRHPDYLSCLNTTAITLSSMGQFSKAVQIHTRCSSLSMKVLGMAHPNYLNSLSCFVCALRGMGQCSTALRLQKACCLLKKNFYGLGSQYLEELIKIGTILLCQGRYEDVLALPYYRLKKFQHIIAVNQDLMINFIRQSLSICYGLKRYGKAIKYLDFYRPFIERAGLIKVVEQEKQKINNKRTILKRKANRNFIDFLSL